jgi:hypothetical protein
LNMMKKRTDHNQAAVIDALRRFGATVQDLSQLGKGTPDILVGYHGRNYLLEIKNATDRAPQLTGCEESWIREWHGQVGVVTTVEDAIAIIQDEDNDDARKP